MTVEAQVSQYIFVVQKFISWLDLQKVYVRKWVDIFDVFYRFWEMLQSCTVHTNTANITDSVRLLPKPLRWSVCKTALSQGQESTDVTAIPDSSDFTPTFTIWHWRGRVSCNNVALPYFTFGYISGEGYNFVGSLLWRKNILMNYLIFPMVFTLHYP